MIKNDHGKIIELDDVRRELGSFSVNKLLKTAGYQNKHLGFDEAYLLGIFALIPHVDSLEGTVDLPRETILVQSVAALCAFHNRALYEKNGSEEQIAGICAAIIDFDIGTSKIGFLDPEVTSVMDNCGMGGDLFRTPNLSTTAALIAASQGINMLKHGSPGNTDNTGSSDFLRYCGADLFPDPAIVKSAVEGLHFGYTDALDTRYKRIHTQTHGVARLAHMNDIIGPITNPVDPNYMKKRVLGINHLIPPERVAAAYKVLNERGVTHVEQGLFVRGYADKARNGGIDEVSIMPGGTRISELKDGEIITYDLYAADFELREVSPAELNPGEHKAEISRKILTGEVTDGKRDSVIANAAILFHLERGCGYAEGTSLARAALDSGKPLQTLESYVAITQGEGR